MKSLIKDLLVLHLRQLNKLPLNSNVIVCTLVSHAHVHRYLESVSSLMRVMERKFVLYIVSDNTLLEKDKILIESIFPQARVFLNTDELMREKLKKYPFLLKYRFSNPENVYIKKIDLLFLTSFKKCLIIDSDILFFSKPFEIKKWIKFSGFLTNTMDPDSQQKAVKSSYGSIFSFKALLFTFFKISGDPFFSGHIWGVSSPHRLNWKKIEKMLRTLSKFYFKENSHVDEVIFSFLMEGSKSITLPPEKYIHLIKTNLSSYPLIPTSYKKPIMIHFSGENKKLFWSFILRQRIKGFILKRKEEVINLVKDAVPSVRKYTNIF